jgi:heat shock protein HslJ
MTGYPTASRIPVSLAAAALLATACGSPVPPVTSNVAITPIASPTIEEISSATFEGILDHPVRLVDGSWEGDPVVEGGASRPAVGLIDHFLFTGDLDGDDVEETAFLLWESSGGSGTRLYLGAADRTADGSLDLRTALIGDRVQIRSGRIEGGEILLEVLRQGPGDAACCPTQWASLRYGLVGAGLRQTAAEELGTAGIADLEGVRWALLELDRAAVPESVVITLEIRGGEVAGKAGCNGYFGQVADDGPGGLHVGELGTTMMACPEEVMETEQRYLAALSGAVAYRFLAGRLALTCETDEGMETLLFEENLSDW